MDLVNSKVFFLQKILVNRFFSYKFLSFENLWQKHTVKGNCIRERSKISRMQFPYKKSHKYFSRLRLFKKNIFIDFLFFFFARLPVNILFSFRYQYLRLFSDKFFFSYNNSIMYPKIMYFSYFYFSLNLIKNTYVNVFLHLREYFFIFYFFVIFLFKKLLKYPLLFIVEFFIDFFLMNKERITENGREFNTYFDVAISGKEKNLFFFDKKIFNKYNFFIPADLSVFF